MSRASRAFAHARVRVLRSRLLRRTDVLPLLCATDDAKTRRALATFGLDPDGEIHPQLFARLMAVYRTVIRAYGYDAGVFRALLRLHEQQNVKVAWRGGNVAPGFSPAEGGLKPAPTLSGDVAAAELALDRQGSRNLLDEALRLPRREALARELIECVICERDNEILRRSERFRGLSAAAARALTVLQREPANPDALRARRMTLCRRAFVGHTFELAPGIAVILLAEEELRAMNALAERRGDAAVDRTVERVLAASRMSEVA